MPFVATLVLAHLLADFPLQTNRIAAFKQKYLSWLLLHVFIHMAATWMLLGMQVNLWPLVLSVGTVHLAIDCLKFFGICKAGIHGFLYDQGAHFLSIILIAFYTLPWYQVNSTFVLPAYILYPALLWAFVLAFMVFWWVWLNSPPTTQRRNSNGNTFVLSHTVLLDIEQRAGFALLFSMTLAVLLIK